MIALMITSVSSTKSNSGAYKQNYIPWPSGIYFKKIRKSKTQKSVTAHEQDEEKKHTLSSQLILKTGKIRQISQSKVLVKLGKGNN